METATKHPAVGCGSFLSSAMNSVYRYATKRGFLKPDVGYPSDLFIVDYGTIHGLMNEMKDGEILIVVIRITRTGTYVWSVNDDPRPVQAFSRILEESALYIQFRIHCHKEMWVRYNPAYFWINLYDVTETVR